MRLDFPPFSWLNPDVWAGNPQRKDRNVFATQRIAKRTQPAVSFCYVMTVAEEALLPALWDVMSRLRDRRGLADVEIAGAA